MSNITGGRMVAAGSVGLFALAVLITVGCRSDDASVSKGAPGDGAGSAELVVLREAVIEDGVPVVAVDRLLRGPADHAGRLAVQGVVVRSIPERGALVLVSADEFKSCGLNACTHAAMPVRIEPGNFEGTLPQPGLFVTMIGDFEAAERGFAFELLEIHHEGGVVLARRVTSDG